LRAPPWSRGRITAVAALLCAVTVLLHLAPLLRPVLVWDDFEILTQSYTWPITQANLWRPANEHTMPLGRITTWLLVMAAGRPSHLPFATALQGPLAVLLGMVLLYLFVSRELGHPVYGLIAMGLFGITSQYEQAVSWFAASFSILALDTLLLALLAAQRWQQVGGVQHLVMSAVWSALAPCWFASGILAGPFCTLYLLPIWRAEGVSALMESHSPDGPLYQGANAPRSPGVDSAHPWLATLLLALVPSLGSAVFLAVSLPRNADHIIHLEHYQMQNETALSAFHLDKGVLYTGRSLVDNLLLGSFGISGVRCPPRFVPVIVLAMAACGLFWWWRASCRRLVVLGVAFILVSYVLIYSARALWSYEQMSVWSRYQLFPHVGLVLMICGGLPALRDWLYTADPDLVVPARLRVASAWLGVGLLLLVLCQAPRSWSYLFDDYYQGQAPAQRHDLRFVEEVDALCREQNIGAETARQVLPTFRVAGASDNARDGWLLLYGSDQPRPLSIEKARQLLQPLADRLPH
jgi:hypothetical protein